MIPREKSSFLRRSGVRNADANAESTDPPATRRTGTSGPGTVGAHLERDPAEIAGAEHLDRRTPADGTGLDHGVGIDGPTVREELRQPLHVHDLVLDPEAVLEALELRQPHVDRHLAALERRGHGVPGLGALGATARALALGAVTTTHAGLPGVRARGRTQVVNLDRHGLLDLLDRDQVRHGLDHAADLRPVFLDHDVADPLEPQRAQRLPLVLFGTDARADLGDLQPSHLTPPARRRAPGAARPVPHPLAADPVWRRSPPGGPGPSGRPRWRARC